MHHQTLADDDPQTIAWVEDKIVDWVRSKSYGASASKFPQIQLELDFPFDRAITSTDGEYAFVYQVLGTNGVLLKNGEPLREISRSDYCATVYEYPAVFVAVNGITYLVHCPVAYNQLDFENVETGELVTNVLVRQPSDVFHSRLEISPEGGYLMSRGWCWHPWDVIKVFDIQACLSNPLLLDESEFRANTYTELCSATFISETSILLGASNEEPMDDEEPLPVPPGYIARWNFIEDKYSTAIKVGGAFGNLFAIDEHRAWDMFKYPKIIGLDTGQVIDKLETLNTGLQCSSIIHHIGVVPAIIYNRLTSQIAVKIGTQLELLSV